MKSLPSGTCRRNETPSWRALRADQSRASDLEFEFELDFVGAQEAQLAQRASTGRWGHPRPLPKRAYVSVKQGALPRANSD